MLEQADSDKISADTIKTLFHIAVASMKTKTILTRIGGKQTIARWVGDTIAPHPFKIYVEPFCGSAAVYLNLYDRGLTKGKTVCLNDRDGWIRRLFETARQHPEELARAIEFTPYSRGECYDAYQGMKDGVTDDIEACRQYLIATYQSFGSTPFKGWGVTFGTRDTKRWNNLPDRIRAIVPALKPCLIDDRDYEKCIEQFDSPDTLFYCDPPYYNKERIYSKEPFNHDRLAAILNQIKGKAIVSYYEHPSILDLYPADKWSLTSKETRTALSSLNKKETEILLVNQLATVQLNLLQEDNQCPLPQPQRS